MNNGLVVVRETNRRTDTSRQGNLVIEQLQLQLNKELDY